MRESQAYQFRSSALFPVPSVVSRFWLSGRTFNLKRKERELSEIKNRPLRKNKTPIIPLFHSINVKISSTLVHLNLATEMSSVFPQKIRIVLISFQGRQMLIICTRDEKQFR